MRDRFNILIEEHQFVANISKKHQELLVVRGGFTPSNSVRTMNWIGRRQIVKPNNLVVLSNTQALSLANSLKETGEQKLLTLQGRVGDLDPDLYDRREKNLQTKIDNIEVIIDVIEGGRNGEALTTK